MPIVVSNRNVALSPSLQQCQIIQLIQETLLKRIGLLCELNGLQTYRDFLFTSLDELGVTIDEQLRDNLIKPNGQCKDTQPYSTTTVSWQGCQDSGILLNLDYLSAYDAAYSIPDLKPTSFIPKFGSVVQEAYNQYKNDCSNLKEKEESFKRQVNHLSNLEFRLQEAMTTFGRTLQELETSHKPDLDFLGRDNGSVLSVATEDSAEDVPPLLEAFYSCKGDIGIHQERLKELSFHHEESFIERGLLKERGHMLDVSDEDYIYDYQRRRLAIEDDLSAASVAANSLAERCRAEGISIPKGLNESEVCLSVESDVSHIPIEGHLPHLSPASKVMRWFQKVVGIPSDSN